MTLRHTAKTLTSLVSMPPSSRSTAHILAAEAATNVPLGAPSQFPIKHTLQDTKPVSPSYQATGSGKRKKGTPLRRGKWSVEEEAYANRLIQEFKAGLLPLTDGTTLRSFLSKLLNCDPMRISKKFVGENCIGKQVFRRKTTDIPRRTHEQTQQSRAELSELQQNFLDVVAQSNTPKSSRNRNRYTNGCVIGQVIEDLDTHRKVGEVDTKNSSPCLPWIRPPNQCSNETGAVIPTATRLSGTDSQAAAAGRKLLYQNSLVPKPSSNMNYLSKPSLQSNGGSGLISLTELHRRQSQQNLLLELAQSTGKHKCSSNLLADAAVGSSNNPTPLVRNSSATRISGLAASVTSIPNMLLKRHDPQSSSWTSFSNNMENQSSLDALLSLDFKSLQSIDKLPNLIQTGTAQHSKSGRINWSGDVSSSNEYVEKTVIRSSANLPNVVGKDSLSCSPSNGNVGTKSTRSVVSNRTLDCLIQTMQTNKEPSGNTSILFGPGSALNFSSMLKVDSSTGLTALRMQDGLTERNSSVDDFLSLVASGDIPHQDPHMLKVPLQTAMQLQQSKQFAEAHDVSSYLAQQQLLADAQNAAVTIIPRDTLSRQITTIDATFDPQNYGNLAAAMNDQTKSCKRKLGERSV